ncbi:neo-calmodulin-like [Ruditapes philippinarum]|uniref:neo-calmodulin-like n=1 Tax=Ruditapes philippinarum TaxID=129788 RepID=UPI00295A64C3|nr:neo-calmodulin-like [Ruditapes philippinarum]
MFQMKADQEMDMDECGMDAGYDPDEDECEQHEAPTGELTESQKEHIKDLYENFDIDKSGTLSLKELRKALQILGLNPTVKDVKDIMKKNDVGPNSKGKKKVTYEVFEQIMKEELLKHTSTEFDLLEAFRLFDRDKNGTLDREELKRCLTSLGECLTDEDVDEVFNQLDTDGSGTLSIVEVSQLLA